MLTFAPLWVAFSANRAFAATVPAIFTASLPTIAFLWLPVPAHSGDILENPH
jgi:hypothetical protein